MKNYCIWCHQPYEEEESAGAYVCVYCKPARDALDTIFDLAPKLLSACRLLLQHQWMRKDCNKSWQQQLLQLRRSLLEYIDSEEDL